MYYAIRLKELDDYVRELSEYVLDNKPIIKTFSSVKEAELFAVQNNFDEEDYVIESLSS